MNCCFSTSYLWQYHCGKGSKDLFKIFHQNSCQASLIQILKRSTTIPFCYASYHSPYIVAEQLKNICQPVIRQHAGQLGFPKYKLSPAYVAVSKDAEDVTKIAVIVVRAHAWYIGGKLT
jgi:hypothetical protein